MKRFHLFFLGLLSCFSVCGQSMQWNWSCLINRLSDTDSAFLVQTESVIWKASADDSVKLRTFDGGRYAATFNIVASKYQTKSMFGDSLPVRNLTDRAELDLAWNHIADTCYILGYAPMLWYNHPQYGRFGPITRDTSVCLRVPTSSYFPFLKEQEFQRRLQLQIDALAGHFGCTRTGDTLSRIIPFTEDSNEYLPQASYRVLLDKVKDGMLFWKSSPYREPPWEFNSYDDASCTIRLSRIQCERKVSTWDSTNKVADPNAPGIFISAPIKYEGQPLSFLVNEKWVPGTQVVQEKYPRIPEPSVIFHRVVVSYGIRFSNGNYVWFKADDIHRYLVMPLLDFSTYEQCFRAERFERMKIFTY